MNFPTTHSQWCGRSMVLKYEPKFIPEKMWCDDCDVVWDCERYCTNKNVFYWNRSMKAYGLTKNHAKWVLKDMRCPKCGKIGRRSSALSTFYRNVELLKEKKK